ncbi:MAG: PAS domain S-box protein [Blastocatellia bacterium]|nr:PAS domain S-box protein [Blastocatellia bacterium]
MSTLNDIDRSLRTALGSIASGASLDSALEAVTSAIRDRTLASSCKIWLVKPGDVCDTCALVDRCADRSMCLHFKASAPHGIEEPARVPLTVFRDRVAARGGVARIGEPSGVGRMLFPSSDVSASAAFAAFPLKGPAGVLGLIAVMRSTPFSHEETDELRSFSDVAVLAVRVADLTSRLQRASYQIGETAETRAEVESLLHAILFGSPEHAVVAEDLQGNITVFGEGARVLYGYEPDEVIGRAKSDVLFAPEEVESGKIVEILNEVMHTGRCESVITRIRKNGERFPSRATITVRRDPDGDPAGFVIVERDLSKERDTARLGESSARQVAQLEDTVVALKSANALLERDVDTLRRQSADLAARASHAFDADEVTAIRIETIRELKGRVAELQSQLLDATTERDALVAGLVRQNASAELSTPSAESHGNAGFRVLADLSQELRSPLSSIVGLSGLVLDGARRMDPREQDAVERIGNSAREMLTLVNNMLDRARIETGEMDLTTDRVDLAEVVGSARTAVEPLAHARRMPIVEDLEPGLPMVVADRLKVRQILVNLLTFSVRNSREGQIRIEARPRSDGVAVSISHSGPGLASDRVQAMLDGRGRGGAGLDGSNGLDLGLSVSRMLADMLGGELTVANDHARGSVLTLRLPNVGPGSVIGASGLLRPIDVVYATSDDTGRLATEALRALGRDAARVDTLERADAILGVAPSAVAIVELGDAGAWSLLDRLARTDDGPRTVAVGTMAEWGRSLARGAWAYAPRPLTRPRIDAAIAKCLGAERSRVLVVDDDPASREILATMLRHPGLDVVVASTWSEAEAGLRPRLPDALVINLGIPGTDGVAVVRFLATQPALSSLGFVLVTAKDLTKADKRALGPSTVVLQQGSFTREELLVSIDRAVTKWPSQS